MLAGARLADTFLVYCLSTTGRGLFSLSCLSFIEIQQECKRNLRWERVTQAAVNLWPLYIHLPYNHSNSEHRLESEASPVAMFTLDH